MEQLRDYLITVICAGIFCGILEAIPAKGSAQSLRKLVCGLFLAVMVISPLRSLSPEGFLPESADWQSEADSFVAEGVALAQQERNARITETAKAYILDKAASLGVALEAELTVSEDGLPTSVILKGSCAPYPKGVLTAEITSELGIPKERQQWIG